MYFFSTEKDSDFPNQYKNNCIFDCIKKRVKNLTTINHLKQQFSIENFAKKTVNQFNKDAFGLVDEELNLPLLDSPNVLEFLMNDVEQLLKTLSDSSNLQQFIYKVDLNEKKWIYFTSFQNYELLAEEVIIREAQKVYLRELFK